MSKTAASRRFALPQAILLSLTILQIASGPQAIAQGPEPSAAERRRFATDWKNGSPVTVTGVVTVFHADDFANGRATVAHMIRDERTGRSFQLRFENGAPGTMRSGVRVRVVGRSLGSELNVAACCDGTTSPNVQTVSQPTAAPSGDQRTLVMIADLLDANVSCSDADVSSTLFAPPTGTFDANGTGLSINAEYLDSSHGKVSWSGQLYRSSLNIRSTDVCDLPQYSQTLDAQAAASGIDVGSYPHKLYVFPPMSQCPFIGASTLGGNPSSSFSFACSNRGVYAHELGHALGMSHAAAYYSAYTAGSGDYDNLLNEYGDYSDSMGVSGSQLPGFNAPHREQMGWLPTSGPGTTQTVTQSGQYSLSPLSIAPSAASAPQVIKIPKADDGGYYYLSYRGGQTFDRYASSYATRVSVHRYGSPLDALSGFTFLYTALANGRAGEDTFGDPVNGITVKMLSGYGTAPGSSAVVDIQITGPSCVRTTPVLAVSPQNQSGSAGGSPSYTVTLTNDDVSSCSPAIFNLSGAVPAGWSGTLSTDTLTLSPGASKQATLTVSSFGGSQVGTYTTMVNTSDPAALVHAASAVATYTVIDTLPPSQPTKLTAVPTNRSKLVQLYWGASSDNVGVIGYSVIRNGSVVGTSTTTSWTDSGWQAGATYTYSVVAKDAAGNISAPSNSATVTLSGGTAKKH